MLELFQQEHPTYLEHEDGCETMIELVTGDKQRGKDKVVGPSWRVNGSSTGHKFKSRIADFYNDNDWGHIGEDKNGHPTSAECAGFGIKDEEWPHHEYAKKGFGERRATDIGLPSFNTSRFGLIYGQ